jgi:hypothetical protein
MTLVRVHNLPRLVGARLGVVNRRGEVVGGCQAEGQGAAAAARRVHGSPADVDGQQEQDQSYMYLAMVANGHHADAAVRPTLGSRLLGAARGHRTLQLGRCRCSGGAVRRARPFAAAGHYAHAIYIVLAMADS